jgi:hypothetical protein
VKPQVGAQVEVAQSYEKMLPLRLDAGDDAFAKHFALLHLDTFEPCPDESW